MKRSAKCRYCSAHFEYEPEVVIQEVVKVKKPKSLWPWIQKMDPEIFVLLTIAPLLVFIFCAFIVTMKFVDPKWRLTTPQPSEQCKEAP